MASSLNSRAVRGGCGSKETSDRVYSVVSFLENGKANKMMVPSIWIDEEQMKLAYPVRKVGESVAKWAKPKKEWNLFEITKVLKEFGSKRSCEEFLRNHVDSSVTEQDSDRTLTPSPSPKKTRFNSPKLGALMGDDVTNTRTHSSPISQDNTDFRRLPKDNGAPSPIIYSPTQTFDYQRTRHIFPSPKKVRRSLLNVAKKSPKKSPMKHKSPKKKSPIKHKSPKKNAKETTKENNPIGRPLTGGGTSFTELDNRTFQYQILMRMGYIEQAIDQQNQSIQSLGRRIEPENSAFNFQKIKSIEEFWRLEEELKDEDFFKLTFSRLKNIGVVAGDVKKSIKKILDYSMEAAVQVQFNRDGGIRIKEMPGVIKKKGICNTLFYKCIRDAISSQGFTILEVWDQIGNVLKKVKVKKTADTRESR